MLTSFWYNYRGMTISNSFAVPGSIKFKNVDDLNSLDLIDMGEAFNTHSGQHWTLLLLLVVFVERIYKLIRLKLPRSRSLI